MGLLPTCNTALRLPSLMLVVLLFMILQLVLLRGTVVPRPMTLLPSNNATTLLLPNNTTILLPYTTTTSTTLPTPKVFAFMTEPRCIASVPFVLQNALDKLPTSFPVVLFHSHHNADCVRRWLDESSGLARARRSGRLVVRQEHAMDPRATRIYHHGNWNNVLYTNATFWRSLYEFGDTALTIQADTVICDNDSANGYTPPWNTNFLGGVSWAVGVQPTNETNTYHLNGGLSIRNLDWTIGCLQSKTSQDLTVPEDNVFCNCTGGLQNVTVVDAMTFSSDNGHTMCFTWNDERICPWGVHKPWMRRELGNYTELVQYCPDVEQLRRLLHSRPTRLVRRPAVRTSTTV